MHWEKNVRLIDFPGWVQRLPSQLAYVISCFLCSELIQYRKYYLGMHLSKTLGWQWDPSVGCMTVRIFKNNKAVGNDGISSEVYKFSSERLLTMSRFLSGCMLTGMLPNLWSYRYWNENQKIQKMSGITGQLQLPQFSSRYLSRSFCHDLPGTCGLQTPNLVSSKHMGQQWPFLHWSKQ